MSAVLPLHFRALLPHTRYQPLPTATATLLLLNYLRQNLETAKYMMLKLSLLATIVRSTDGRTDVNFRRREKARAVMY